MKIALIIIAILFSLGALSICEYACNKAKENVTENAFLRYEEYQEIYNTCQQLNSDLCNVKDVPSEDKMFEQFSKSQRITGIKQKINRWIEDYNAKSKMWNRALWKSSKLPYQLSSSDFNCYN